MKRIHKITAIFLAVIMCMALSIPAFAVTQESSMAHDSKTAVEENGLAVSHENEAIKAETVGVVIVDGAGKYDFGDGSIVTIEPIPGLWDEITEDVAEVKADEIKNTKVQVNGEGRYDLGDGVFLTIEPIPEDELDIECRLYETNSNLALTSEWTKFCYDEPLLETNLKIYNNSTKNPGNLNASVHYPHGFLRKEVYGIEPGYMATIEGINDYWYYVYLSASVDGNYKVKVTDWP